MYSEKPFYVYVHRKATDGSVFYVGKGKGNRIYSRTSRSQYWKNIVAKHGLTANIIMQFESEICAFSFERVLIRLYGRENLCNATDGGEGISGMRHSDETKAKMSGPRPECNNWLRGKHIPDYLKIKLRDAKLGKKQSDKHANKSRIAKLGFKVSDTSKFNLDKRKMVVRCDGVVFNSVNDAARIMSKELSVNVSQGNISMVLTGVRKMAYGYKWSYHS